jgi:multidrug efflux pump subunit AcrB
VGALLPLATSGSAMYSPLAWVIIGGLVSSLVLSRVVTPVMYGLLPPKGGEGSSQSPVASCQNRD